MFLSAASSRRWQLRMLTVLCLVSALSASSLGAVRADVSTQKINTIDDWNGSSYIFAFGSNGATATYGQTITARAETPRLQRFTFVVKISPQERFRGYVYQWDPVEQRATGVARWSSLTRRTSAYEWQRVTLDTGGLYLAPGKMYVIFLSVTGLKPTALISRYGWFGEPQARDLYRGGAFVFFNNSSVSQWTTERWDGGRGDGIGVQGADLAFKAVSTS